MQMRRLDVNTLKNPRLVLATVLLNYIFLKHEARPDNWFSDHYEHVIFGRTPGVALRFVIAVLPTATKGPTKHIFIRIDLYSSRPISTPSALGLGYKYKGKGCTVCVTLHDIIWGTDTLGVRKTTHMS